MTPVERLLIELDNLDLSWRNDIRKILEEAEASGLSKREVRDLQKMACADRARRIKSDVRNAKQKLEKALKRTKRLRAERTLKVLKSRV
jgi:hypothetical protein